MREDVLGALMNRVLVRTRALYPCPSCVTRLPSVINLPSLASFPVHLAPGINRGLQDAWKTRGPAARTSPGFLL
jgi:hypothetical protein